MDRPQQARPNCHWRDFFRARAFLWREPARADHRSFARLIIRDMSIVGAACLEPLEGRKSMVESSWMDTAAGFVKSLTGEAHNDRSVTPPPPSADDSPPDSPISSFRKEPVYEIPDFPEAEGDNNEGFETSILMIQSFGSLEHDIVEPNHIYQAREAISSVTSSSRLSDERIHQILLAAMHYQTDKSHTLPSRRGQERSPQRPRKYSVESAASAPLQPFQSSLLRRSVSAPEPFQLSSSSGADEDDEEFSVDQYSIQSNAGDNMSQSSDRTPQPWHESSNNAHDQTPMITNISATRDTSSPKPDKTVSISMDEPTDLVGDDLQSTPPKLQRVAEATLRHLDSPLAAPPSALAARIFRSPEEKKDDRHPLTAAEKELLFVKSLSMTESDVGSLDGLPSRLRRHWQEEGERFLEQLDGVTSTPINTLSRTQLQSPVTSPFGSYTNLFAKRTTGDAEERQENSTSILRSLGISYFWGENVNTSKDDNERQKPYKFSWKEETDDTLALLGCAPLINPRDDIPPAMANSLVRVTDGPHLPSFAESIKDCSNDCRLSSWVEGLYRQLEPAPYDGSYGLGKSRTVILHEICRGDWTWCTAWSPKGDRLAVGTENHHLAVVETMSSAVWRIRHDRRLTGPAKNHTTHSIRSIAWGKRFIATGGTGDAVSIISSIEPYPILDVVKDTGFVGSIAWKPDSDILAIGSRLGQMTIVKVQSTESRDQAESEILHTVRYDNWVNKVVFSPGGTYLAVGVATGEVFVYNFWQKPDESLELSDISSFRMEDSILDIAWSPDGKWLYAGGEDFRVSVIDTRYWQIVHRIKQDRWVQSISSSYGGTHVAVAAGNAEVSILDVANGWDSVMGIELKGLVPLSSEWHPKDQAIALTGQSESILVVETSDARHVRGHHLRSISPILAIEFSPDGRLVLIGNEGGVVTLFSLSKYSFEVVYEMAVTFNDRLSMGWSRNGVYAVVGSRDALLILGRRPPNGRHPKSHRSTNPVGFGDYSIQKVVKSIGPTNSVSIDNSSRFVAVGVDRTIIYDSTLDFRPVMEWQHGKTIALEWSPDRRFLATMGGKNTLTIYDTSSPRPCDWTPIFSLKCDFPGRALSWSPRNVGGLQYLAYGGLTNHIYIVEIRTVEHTWETVLRIPRQEHVYSLDWSSGGLLAAGSHKGTVAIVDLSYLQFGIPVREKDYKWQRQALTCFTEIRRNRGHNIFQSVRWIPSAPGSDNLLAVGGTDGEVEIVDLTERKNCRGYSRKKKSEGLSQ